MNKALVQNPQDNVNHQDGHEQQQAKAGEGRLEGLRAALQAGADGLRQNLGSHLVHRIDGIANGRGGREIEAERHRRHLAEMVHGERSYLVFEIGYGIQRDKLAGLRMNVKHP